MDNGGSLICGIYRNDNAGVTAGSSGTAPGLITTSHAENARSLGSARSGKAIFIREVGHQSLAIASGGRQSGIRINIPSYDVNTLEPIRAVIVPHLLEFLLKLGCISSPAAARAASAYFGKLPLLFSAAGISSPGTLGAVSSSISGQIAVRVLRQSDGVDVGFVRDLGKNHVAVNVARSLVQSTVPVGARTICIQSIGLVGKVLDVLFASGGKGVNNPILVIAAGGRVDVDLRTIGDTCAARNIEGTGRCGQRTERISCHT